MHSSNSRNIFRHRQYDMTKLSLSILIIIACSFSIKSTLSAQRLGFGPSINTIEDYYSLGYSLGPGHGISFAMDKLISEEGNGLFGFGLIFNARSQQLRNGNQVYAVGAGKITYHPHLFDLPRLDLYGHLALGIGYEEVSNHNRYTGPRQEIQRTYTAWGLAIGARYRIFDRFGIYAEGGYGIGYLNTGITWNI